MNNRAAQCLILSCGNTLRGDDGVGPCLAEWAEERFRTEARVRVLSRQQWTPELAEDVARADSVLFIDCSADAAPGEVAVVPVEPAADTQGLATHHLGAAELLGLGRILYDSLPRNVVLLTIGAGSTALGEEFSAAVKRALPDACRQIEETVTRFLPGTVPAEAT
ncbi:MAG TPA: hydrogenase maturation protease [Terracidiphilus sp.]|nr:hydrogenase maturation protease [Terracidiphilus sp.]